MTAPAPPLTPQAALEQAVRDAIREHLHCLPQECDRCFDGRPPAVGGPFYLAVWSDCGRQSNSRTSLDETLRVAVTGTVRLVAPRDRWVAHRDDLVRRMDEVRALVHRDTHGHAIRRAANALAGLGDAASRHVGFVEALAFERLDEVRAAPSDWLGGRGDAAAIVQTAWFGKARLVQAIRTAR